ncbi:hypothetical protein L198_06648 [Cryptococcus wingfieldii CBS 7118]|uniref:Uncharacterized protein n=1 Tax=Cryptococcus wingfieldii CBS 7118 TaxID=1295528 RepID=A0A1E3ILM3_9TREE|nr:hypothetical protein L198_06648 [Cryptococcus wingfieldii CBS 7118]ODN88846.1 hypothetical protein L198_06648 [Cryptococcus wingfieldii CBS 7118]
MSDGDIDQLARGEDYERERLDNIRERDALLLSLGLETKPQPAPRTSTPVKRPTLSKEEKQRRKASKMKELAVRREQPTRKSRRVEEREDGKGREGRDRRRTPSPGPRYDPLPKAIAPTLAPGPDYAEAEGETYYERAPRPTRGQDGRLEFEGRFKGVFAPNLTPEEMFAGGAFGGGFFRDVYSRVAHRQLSSTESTASLPFSPSSSALPPHLYPRLLTNPTPQASVNRFKVKAGQSLQEWEEAGWIWAGDPRGWAEWYVRFWEGRRGGDDGRQVNRWLKVAGPTGRFKRALLKKLLQAGAGAGGNGSGREMVEVVEDEDVGRVLRQCLWQWGYVLDGGEFERALGGS